jgi:hypothetical protein
LWASITYLCSIDFSHAERVNLNKAKKLKDVAFVCWLHPGWILATLRTVTSKSHRELKQVTLMMVSSRSLSYLLDVKDAVGGAAYEEWLELDRFLVQLCESQSIYLKVPYNVRDDMGGGKEQRRMKVLLPEVMTRGMVGLVGEDRMWI